MTMAMREQQIKKNEQVNYRKGNKGDDNNKQVGNNNNNEGKETKECWNFNAGTCTYGNKCIYIHKEICRAWKKYGDCKSSKCQFNHPKLCFTFFEGSCNRTNCSYLHKTETSNMKGKNQQRFRNAAINHEHGNNFGHPTRIQQNIRKNNGGLGQSRNYNHYQRKNQAHERPYWGQDQDQNFGHRQNRRGWSPPMVAEMGGTQPMGMPMEIMTKVMQMGWQSLMNQGNGMWE